MEKTNNQQTVDTTSISLSAKKEDIRPNETSEVFDKASEVEKKQAEDDESKTPLDIMNEIILLAESGVESTLTEGQFEKMMTSYIGTSIEDKPAWLKRGEKLHGDMHKKLTKNYIPTVQEAIKFIDCWIEFYNSKPCPNDRSKTIQEMLNGIQKQDIDKNILNDLMMKTEARTINKHGITEIMYLK